MSDESVCFQQMGLFALKLAGGHCAVLAGRTPEGNVFFACEQNGAVAGFRLRADTPAAILNGVRGVCRQFGRGALNPELYLPVRVAASVPVVAQFDPLTGVVEAVASGHGPAWETLRLAMNPITFRSTPADLRRARELSQEVYPGILLSPAGELAVREGDAGDWEVVDTQDAWNVAGFLLPKLRERRPDAPWQEIYLDLLRFVPDYVAQDAIEAHDEDALAELDHEALAVERTERPEGGAPEIERFQSGPESETDREGPEAEGPTA